MKFKVAMVNFNSKAMDEAKKRVLDSIARKGVKIFKQEIRRRDLVNTKNLLNSVGATIKKNSVTFDINADYAGILNEGVKRHKMTYLVNKGPIPIVSHGRTFFRVATTKNVKKPNKWLHPGFKRGRGFVDDSIVKIKSTCADIIAQEGLT